MFIANGDEEYKSIENLELLGPFVDTKIIPLFDAFLDYVDDEIFAQLSTEEFSKKTRNMKFIQRQYRTSAQKIADAFAKFAGLQGYTFVLLKGLNTNDPLYTALKSEHFAVTQIPELQKIFDAINNDLWHQLAGQPISENALVKTNVLDCVTYQKFKWLIMQMR